MLQVWGSWCLPSAILPYGWILNTWASWSRKPGGEISGFTEREKAAAKVPKPPTDPEALSQGKIKKMFFSVKVSRQGESCLSDTDSPLCLVGLEFLWQEQSHSLGIKAQLNIELSGKVNIGVSKNKWWDARGRRFKSRKMLGRRGWCCHWRGRSGDNLAAPTVLASGLSWRAAQTIQSPHLVPCHAHVYFRTQMTVPKAMWRWKTK